jgi:hypothetical protein
MDMRGFDAVAPGKTLTIEKSVDSPGVSAIHVMVTILETVYDGASEIRHVQTYGVPPGSGAMVEFRISEPGTYGLVDRLATCRGGWC